MTAQNNLRAKNASLNCILSCGLFKWASKMKTKQNMFYHCSRVAEKWWNLCASAVSIRKRAFWMIICDCSSHCIMFGYRFRYQKSPIMSWAREANLAKLIFLIDTGWWFHSWWSKKSIHHRFVARFAHTHINSGLHPRAKWTCITYLIECEMFSREGSKSWQRGIIWGLKMPVWIHIVLWSV